MGSGRSIVLELEQGFFIDMTSAERLNDGFSIQNGLVVCLLNDELYH